MKTLCIFLVGLFFSLNTELGKKSTFSKMQNKTKFTPTNRYTESINGTSFDMIYVEAGTFTMGSPKSEDKRESDEIQHEVTLSGFAMSETEVTQKLWQAVMGNNPSVFKNCDQCPVENVSWFDCEKFIQKLNAMTLKKYRLPTEAEWEYTCRAGTKTPFNTGTTLSTEQAHFSNKIHSLDPTPDSKYGNKTIPVKTYTANNWGFYDMHGNVREWCSDWYGAYTTFAQTNPKGAENGTYKVLRGGDWNFSVNFSRSAFRFGDSPKDSFSNTGFRLCISN